MIHRVRFVATQLVMIAALYGIAAGQATERARVGLIVTTPALKDAFVKGLA